MPKLLPKLLPKIQDGRQNKNGDISETMQGYSGLNWSVSGLWKRVRILAQFNLWCYFFTLGGVAENLSGQHTRRVSPP